MAEGSKENSVRLITLDNGFQVGIANLDKILEEVAGLQLPRAADVETELMARVKAENYVAPGAEREYAVALLKAYRQKYEPPVKLHKTPPKKKHAF